MKSLLRLAVLGLTLTFCCGFCLYKSLRAQFKDGQQVMPDGCIDPFDNSSHQFGSAWNTTLCLRCNCEKYQLRCCTRYKDVGSTLECTPIVNPQTCEQKLYKKDDPTKLCF